MPAPETNPETKTTFNHVNLMVDSFLANVEADELRAIVRSTLASCPPSTAAAFTAAARKRLTQTNAKAPLPTTLFVSVESGLSIPGEMLEITLRRSRSLYGTGMGLASLSVLANVVQATVGRRWEDNGPMINALVAVDADISQAIQSAKEELAAGRISDFNRARAVVYDLEGKLVESLKDLERWGGDFPFEKALASVEYWKL